MKSRMRPAARLRASGKAVAGAASSSKSINAAALQEHLARSLGVSVHRKKVSTAEKGAAEAEREG